MFTGVTNTTNNSVSPPLLTTTTTTTSINITPLSISINNNSSPPQLTPNITTPMEYTSMGNNNNNNNNSNMNDIATIGGTSVRIVVQPEKYQVVNYNIHPPPQLEFLTPYNDPITIQAFLVYENGVEIKEGFTNGDVQVLKVTSNKVTFPALHLNRMTPIKNAIQQSGSFHGNSINSNSSNSNSKDNYPYSVKFKIGDVTIFSTSFKLVSACNQIPSGVGDVRPRKNKTSSKADRDNKEYLYDSTPATPINNNNTGSNKPIASKTTTSKRRATVENTMEEEEEEIYFHVKMSGETGHRGFITLYKEASLKQARDEITKSNQYPKNFRFWFEKMRTIVQPHQENSIRAIDAIDGTCLILDPYDPIMVEIDEEMLALWLTKKGEKEPVVPILDVIRKLFELYGKELLQYAQSNSDLNQISVINGGISHFLVNITKTKEQPGMVSLEDFKLFLKFFGPIRNCLVNVFNIYRESCFHGFSRHSDSVELLKGKPGHFLVRYSESQLKDGFFAFNVNRGNSMKDLIENYSIRYHSDIEAFIFRNKHYSSLREFIQDTDYSHILRFPISKTTVETIKESNYRNDTDFLRASSDKGKPF